MFILLQLLNAFGVDKIKEIISDYKEHNDIEATRDLLFNLYYVDLTLPQCEILQRVLDNGNYKSALNIHDIIKS